MEEYEIKTVDKHEKPGELKKERTEKAPRRQKVRRE